MTIHWLVHYLLHGNAANIHVGDECSHLSEPDSQDEDWLQGMGFLSIISIYN